MVVFFAVSLLAALSIALIENTVIFFSCAHVVITRADWALLFWNALFWALGISVAAQIVWSVNLALEGRRRWIKISIGLVASVTLASLLYRYVAAFAFIQRNGLSHVAPLGFILVVLCFCDLFLFHQLAGWDIRRRNVFSVIYAVIAVAAAWLSRAWLPRLFPVLHWALIALIALFVARSWALLLEKRDVASKPRLFVWFACALLLAGLSWWRLPSKIATSPDAIMAIQQCSPISGWLWQPMLKRVGRAQSQLLGKIIHTVKAPEPAVPSVNAPSIPKQSILLITVDALRADGVRPDIMPCLSEMASNGFSFAHAYSPTPHTSYALTSLHTSKYLRPLMALPQGKAKQPSPHATWASLMRRYGYRTAAFYPPAIFFVDHERFLEFEKDGLGFEYRKAQFSKAIERIAELDAYLAQNEDQARPLFVWVHLFEPHEPYEPSEDTVRKMYHLPMTRASARQRYNGEVRAVDDAICELKKRFFQHRENASVVVTSDHGEEFGDHGGYYHGTTLYDEQVRVPWVWSFQSPQPKLVTCPVETIDIATTVLGALGLPKEARMRGDDLSQVLFGSATCEQSGARFAFSEIGDAKMATDGADKVICHFETGRCEHYDLKHDPAERRDLGLKDLALVRNVRDAIGQWIASVPNVEAMALDSTHWPDVLTRARLGDPTSGPQLIELLKSSASEPVTAEALRAVGQMHETDALAVVEAKLKTDSLRIRRAAAVAYLQICKAAAPCEHTAHAVSVLNDALSSADTFIEASLRLDAAIAMLDHGYPTGLRLIVEAVRRRARPDGTEDTEIESSKSTVVVQEEEQIAAITALGRSRAALSADERKVVVDALVELLLDVRLRISAAQALGAFGDPRALPFLRRALKSEPYLAAQKAEADAITALSR